MKEKLSPVDGVVPVMRCPILTFNFTSHINIQNQPSNQSNSFCLLTTGSIFNNSVFNLLYCLCDCFNSFTLLQESFWHKMYYPSKMMQNSAKDVLAVFALDAKHQ